MDCDGLNRRRFFGTSALAALAALMARPAAAIRIEDASEDRQALFMSACETRAAHQQLVEELTAQLETQEGHDKAVQIVAAMNCPYCGCRLASIQPYDAKF